MKGSGRVYFFIFNQSYHVHQGTNFYLVGGFQSFRNSASADVYSTVISVVFPHLPFMRKPLVLKCLGKLIHLCMCSLASFKKDIPLNPTANIRVVFKIPSKFRVMAPNH